MISLADRIAKAQREQREQRDSAIKAQESAAKKTAAKKTAAKKTAAKKTAAKKTAAKKAAAKKTAAKKTAAKKTAAKKTALILDSSESVPLIPPATQEACVPELKRMPTLREILDYLSLSISGTQNLELVYTSLLGMVSGTSVLALGPAGSGKSYTVNTLFSLCEGSVGKCQVHPFMERAELVGSIDMKSLDQGRIRTRWEESPVNKNYLFLDEIDKGGEAVQSALLSVLNERQLYDEGEIKKLPIKGLVATANDAEEMTGPMLDRFVLTNILSYENPSSFLDEYDSLFDSSLREEYDRKYNFMHDYVPSISNEVLAHWKKKAREARASIRDPRLADVRNDLKKSLDFLSKTIGGLSQRRTVQLVEIMAANAAINGRNYITPSDFGVLIYAPKDILEQRAVLTYLTNHQSLTKVEKLGICNRDGTQGVFGSPKHFDLIKAYLASLTKVRDQFSVITK